MAVTQHRLSFVVCHLLSVCLSLSLEVSLQHFLHWGHRSDPGGCWPLSGLLLPAVPRMEPEEGCPWPACMGDCRPVDPRQTGVRRGDLGTGRRVQEQPGTRSWSWSEGRGRPGGQKRWRTLEARTFR